MPNFDSLITAEFLVLHLFNVPYLFFVELEVVFKFHFLYTIRFGGMLFNLKES